MEPKVSITSDYRFYCCGETGLNSKVYVFYGLGKFYLGCRNVQNAGLHCSDPVKNEWEVKATTCKPHFALSPFVVNNRIYVAEGV